MKWFPKKGKTHLVLSCHKKDKSKKKMTFDISKFKFQNGTRAENFNLLAFLRQAGVWAPGPPHPPKKNKKKCASIFFANSESCEHRRDFGTWVGR